MWDKRYDRPDYLFGTRPAAFLVQQAQEKEHSFALKKTFAEKEKLSEIKDIIKTFEMGIQLLKNDKSSFINEDFKDF